VRALFAENKVRFARAEQLLLCISSCKVQVYGGVKRPHPTIHSRHVYNSQLVL